MKNWTSSSAPTHSEQSGGILVLIIAAFVIGYNVDLELPTTVADPYCVTVPEPTGRDDKGIQTFEYRRECHE